MEILFKKEIHEAKFLDPANEFQEKIILRDQKPEFWLIAGVCLKH